MYDVIVIGVGSMGSSTCYYLAKRGANVLGLEQFDSPHENGSHAGQSRIIRKAYFEHPNYVPLLDRAYDNWKDLEAKTNTQIYYQTGLVYFGPANHAIIKGVKKSAALYNVKLDQLDANTVAKRFPQFNIPQNFECLFEPEAGFIRPESAITLYKDLAIKAGATIYNNEKVIDWKADDHIVTVVTDNRIYQTKRLVITAGAWAARMIPGYDQRLKITRQPLVWIDTGKNDDYILSKFPCWMIADDNKPGCYYGFPALPVKTFGDPVGLKLGYHHPAQITDPGEVNRQRLEEDDEDISWFLDRYMPGLNTRNASYKICLYANSPDEDFIIDHLPGYDNRVTIACGFSGHGFKFASVIGEILADLTLDGATKNPIDFLTAKRFSG